MQAEEAAFESQRKAIKANERAIVLAAWASFGRAGIVANGFVRDSITWPLNAAEGISVRVQFYVGENSPPAWSGKLSREPLVYGMVDEPRAGNATYVLLGQTPTDYLKRLEENGSLDPVELALELRRIKDIGRYDYLDAGALAITAADLPKPLAE